jgi:hypothetical protein
VMLENGVRGASRFEGKTANSSTGSRLLQFIMSIELAFSSTIFSQAMKRSLRFWYLLNPQVFLGVYGMLLYCPITADTKCALDYSIFNDK